MIVISAVLVVAGAALLVAGLIASGLTLIYVSLGVTIAAAILLLLGVRGGGLPWTPRPAVATAGAAGRSPVVEVPAPPAEPQRPPAEDVPVAAAAPAVTAPEPVPAADLVATAGIVSVISGRPRYHVHGCRFVSGREEAEDITVEEARELGFTPCGACKPDDHLVAGSALPLEPVATAVAQAPEFLAPVEERATTPPPARKTATRSAPAKAAARAPEKAPAKAAAKRTSTTRQAAAPARARKATTGTATTTTKAAATAPTKATKAPAKRTTSSTRSTTPRSTSTRPTAATDGGDSAQQAVRKATKRVPPRKTPGS